MQAHADPGAPVDGDIPEVDGHAILAAMGLTVGDDITQIILHPLAIEVFHHDREHGEWSDIVARLKFS